MENIIHPLQKKNSLNEQHTRMTWRKMFSFRFSVFISRWNRSQVVQKFSSQKQENNLRLFWDLKGEIIF